MNRLILIALNVVWGLWFGGLVMLLIAVTSLFRTAFADDHTLAGTAAAGIFHASNQFRLGLAAAALLISAGYWLWNRSVWNLAAFILFALAAVATFTSSAVLTPRIEHLRVEQLTKSAEFARLHGMSMSVFLAETVLVFVAGVLSWGKVRGL